MTLTDNERAFIDKRRRLIAIWPWAGGGIIAGMLGFASWLWLAVPMMINPWATMRSIEAGSVEETTLIMMAVMLPILMLACLGALVVMIALFFAAFSNERRLIKIVDRLDSRPHSG
jgi:hypothetical protein